MELEGTVCWCVCQLRISRRAKKETDERKKKREETTITQGECDNNNQTSLNINQTCTKTTKNQFSQAFTGCVCVFISLWYVDSQSPIVHHYVISI